MGTAYNNFQQFRKMVRIRDTNQMMRDEGIIVGERIVSVDPCDYEKTSDDIEDRNVSYPGRDGTYYKNLIRWLGRSLPSTSIPLNYGRSRNKSLKRKTEMEENNASVEKKAKTKIKQKKATKKDNNAVKSKLSGTGKKAKRAPAKTKMQKSKKTKAKVAKQ